MCIKNITFPLQSILENLHIFLMKDMVVPYFCANILLISYGTIFINCNVSGYDCKKYVLYLSYLIYI